MGVKHNASYQSGENMAKKTITPEILRKLVEGLR